MELITTPRNSQLPTLHIPLKHSHGLWSKNHEKFVKYQNPIWENWLPETKSDRSKQTENTREKENKWTNSLNNVRSNKWMW